MPYPPCTITQKTNVEAVRRRKRSKAIKPLPSPGGSRQRHPKAHEVVAVAGRVPVATGGAAVPRVVDPGAAAQDTTVILLARIVMIRTPFPDVARHVADAFRRVAQWIDAY